MPTGDGKSAVYVAYALITKRPTAIVTESLGLQAQLMRDFSGLGMVELKGRGRYDCDLRDDYSCEDGFAARCPRRNSHLCPLSRSQQAAAASFLVVTNFAKWTQAKRFGLGLEHQTQVVFDEGHSAPEAVAKAMQVVLHHKEVEETLGLDFPATPEEMVDWKAWAIKARIVADDELAVAKAAMTASNKGSQVRHYLHMRNLVRRLNTLATAQPHNWIADEHSGHKGQTDGYQFDPLRPGSYTESALFLKMEHVLIFSATIRPKTLYQLHQAKNSFAYWEFPSSFNPADTPIYHVPTMQVDMKHPDLTPLWIRLDQVAARRTDRKGIVQTVSFAKRDQILATSRFASSMLINQRGEAASEIVEQFKRSGPGTILVSPSVGSGYDFPGSACEWQFICKVPFPDSRSKIMKARQEDDKEYGPYLAMNKLVQICGRGARYVGDVCENVIADNHIQWFLPRYGHLAPKWFKAFFKVVDYIPAPPPRL